MLIRISGGHGGIRTYLETGKKRGRIESRDLLDERIPLRGDIELMDACIESIHGKGEKYLHITLSFKEDHLEQSVYTEIIDRFERFAFSAYRDDEYMMYAEAHLPRRKSFIDKSTGRVITRKPHIHIVIPKRNLLSGRGLNPFGMLYRTSKYIDAFQEDLNSDLGLASPKEHRRRNLEGKSEIIARTSGLLPSTFGRNIKESILSMIIKQNISSLDELEVALSSYGTVRRRNAGKPSAYLNVKPPEASKGINLKEHVFSDAFLKLPIIEKRKTSTDNDTDYIEQITKPTASPQYSILLAEWRDLVSMEIKYLNSGNKNEYKRYQNLELISDKTNYLQLKQDKFYSKFSCTNRKGLPQIEENSIREYTSFESKNVMASIEPPEKHNCGTNPIAHAVRNKEEADNINRDAERTKEAKNHLAPESLLEYIAKERGLIISKYKTARSKDGYSRIICGSRVLNLADFLTKEIHLPWIQAAEILASLYTIQTRTIELEPIVRPSQHDSPSRDYTTTNQAEKKDRAPNLQVSRRLKELRSTMLDSRDEIYKDLCITRAAKRYRLSILQTSYLAEIEHVIDDATNERNSTPRRSDVALRSLDETHAYSSSSPIFRPLFRELDHVFRIYGAVDYIKNGKTIMRDTGKRIIAIQDSDEALEACLRLATVKYGSIVRVYGSSSFKLKIARVAVTRKMRITFFEPELERIRRNLAAEKHNERDERCY